MERSNSSRIRNGNDGVDVVVWPRLEDALSQALALVETGLIHRNAVDDGIWTREIHVLEDARCEGFGLRAHLVEQMT